MNMKSKQKDIENRLCNLLETFAIPEFRKDATKWHNLKWLNENLHLKNVQNIDYDEVRILIRMLLFKLGDNNE